MQISKSKIQVWDSKLRRRRKGSFLPAIMMASVLFLGYATVLAGLAMSNVKMAELQNKKTTAMTLAEAGVNYYMWHLAHNDKDYCDGLQPADQNYSAKCINPDGATLDINGPFIHNYLDQSGNSLGTYALYITPPTGINSSTTVKSVGKVSGKSPERTVLTQINMPSFTKYTLLVNGEQLWVGPSEKITGNVHVNTSGLRNDGEITGDASSTALTYDSWWGTHDGIWGEGIFGGAKMFPVPKIDFGQLNVDTVKLRTISKDGGNYYDSSGQQGYHLVLKGSTYDLFKVNKYDAGYYDITKEDTAHPVASNLPYPSNGVIFLEDKVWLEGKIDNKKVTIIASDPEANTNNQKEIYLVNPLLYTNYDGRDKIGLLTQKNITVTHNAPSVMEIDAAMIAQDGYISICPANLSNTKLTDCSDHPKGYIKDKIKVYGSMAHKAGLVWTFDWGSGVLSGYRNTETVIDHKNVLDPPPYFPKTGSFSIQSWREE